jgi:hypothetical protein
LPDGNLAFEITITDAKGNATTRTTTTNGSTLTLDRTPPVVVTQAASYTLDSSGRAAVELDDVYVSSSDANGIARVALELSSMACSNVGTFITEVVDVIDNAGNRTEATAAITVTDDEFPVITSSWAATITTPVGVYPSNPNPQYSDNCGRPNTSSNLDDLNVSFPNTFVYTTTATDGSGNVTTYTRNVVVVQCEYVYEDGSWTPNDPGASTNPSDINDNVVIKDDVTMSNDFIAKTLIIEENVTLSLASNVEIEIADLANDGVLEARDAAIIPVSNTRIPTVDRSWNSNESHIGTLWGNCCFTLLGNYNIYDKVYQPPTSNLRGGGQLTVTDANFVFKASITKAAIVDGNIMMSGDVIVEKYFDDIRAFRFMSSTVTSTSTIFDNWQQSGLNQGDANYKPGYGTHITGPGAGANGFDATGTNASSMFLWDNIGQSWLSQTSTNQSGDLLVAGDASRLFIRGDRDVALTSNNTSSSTTLTEQGGLRWNAYSVPDIPVNGGEFLLVGNPFLSDVNLNSLMTATATGSSSVINAAQTSFYYVWDPALNLQGAYRTYDRSLDMLFPSVTNSTYNAGSLRPGQAAFFLASGQPSGQFQIPNPHVNTSGVGGGALSTNTQVLLLRIDLFDTATYTQGGGQLDATMIKFELTGNNDVDQYDAPKFSNIDEGLSRIHSAGDYLSIESRAMPVSGETLGLSPVNYRHTAYTFEIPAVGFTAQNAILEDQFTGISTVLSNTATSTYNFTVDPSDANSTAANRFRIIFEDVTLSTGDVALVDAIELYPNPVMGNTFFINMAGISGEKEVVITNLLGQQIQAINTQETGVLEVITTDLAPAVYLVKISTEGRTKIIKVLVE